MRRMSLRRSRLFANGPLYAQLVEALRGEVARMLPGDRVDSETKLTKRFGVSRFTIARALEILVEEGVLIRRQGLGTFVAPPTLKRAPSYLLSFSEAVAAAGYKASQRLLAFAPAAWRADLPYDQGEALIAFDRLRLVDNAPAAIHRSVIAASVAAKIGLTASAARQPDLSLYRLFDQAGLAVARGLETLRARCASPEEADLLRLPRHEPPVIVSVRRQTFGLGGAVLDVVDAVYDARRYAYEAEMRRFSLASSLTAPVSTRENDNAYSSIIRHDFGPRLGPWGDLSRERG